MRGLPTSSPLFLNADVLTRPPAGVDHFKLTILDGAFRLANIFLRALQGLLYRPVRDPHKILIFRTGSLGDSLCALPAIKSIIHSYPHAKVDILTNTGGGGLAGLNHLLDPNLYSEVIDYSGYTRSQLFWMLKSRRYDLVIQLPQVDAPFLSLVRDLIFFRWVACSGFGWQKSQVPFFQKTQFRHLQFKNEVARLKSLLAAHSIEVAESEKILEPDPKHLRIARDFLDRCRIDPSRPLVAVVPGAKRPQNRWPLSHFSALIEKLSVEHAVILIGSAEDKQFSELLKVHPNVYDACGVFSPLESAAMLSLCQLTISNDTGPMHLSYSVQTPTLALFSSRDLPGKWYPAISESAVLRGMRIPCEACFSDTCQNNLCMQTISVDMVYAKAIQMLKGR